eukprot:gnl/Hemi2/9690_TR3372_c0_g1_i1.p1 gnl/Hemi2/9690_TR3372_c0_g1~~gnl/Hemi2/9690_TR3372_c0_g1_i1.p1  ORF type:complete len:281 (+),score=62.27 gnl/Hemi2/9690_TR3372_c0_g1_i1:39-881(+)
MYSSQRTPSPLRSVSPPPPSLLELSRQQISSQQQLQISHPFAMNNGPGGANERSLSRSSNFPLALSHGGGSQHNLNLSGSSLLRAASVSSVGGSNTALAFSAHNNASAQSSRALPNLPTEDMVVGTEYSHGLCDCMTNPSVETVLLMFLPCALPCVVGHMAGKMPWKNRGEGFDACTCLVMSCMLPCMPPCCVLYGFRKNVQAKFGIDNPVFTGDPNSNLTYDHRSDRCFWNCFVTWCCTLCAACQDVDMINHMERLEIQRVLAAGQTSHIAGRPPHVRH